MSIDTRPIADASPQLGLNIQSIVLKATDITLKLLTFDFYGDL